MKDWGESVSELMTKTITRNCTQCCLAGVFLPFVHVIKFYFVSCVLLVVLSCLVCNCCRFGRVYCCSCLVWVSSYVYLLCCVCIAGFLTLDAGLLARSQHSEGPATGHLDTGFSRFPCA